MMISSLSRLSLYCPDNPPVCADSTGNHSSTESSNIQSYPGKGNLPRQLGMPRKKIVIRRLPPFRKQLPYSKKIEKRYACSEKRSNKMGKGITVGKEDDRDWNRRKKRSKRIRLPRLIEVTLDVGKTCSRANDFRMYGNPSVH